MTRWGRSDRTGRLLARVIGATVLLACTCALAQDPETLAEDEQEETKRTKALRIVGRQAYEEVIASGRYRVGPGDRFLVSIAGIPGGTSAEARVPGLDLPAAPFRSEVMAEGGLFIPGVGTVEVGGLRLREARERAQAAFRAAFKEAEMTLELAEIRTFPVSVVGVMPEPGVVLTSGVERVSEVLRAAGGVGSSASRRNIRVVKRDAVTASQRRRLLSLSDPFDYLGLNAVSTRVDLELHEASGASGLNPFVEDGDIIVVPPQSGQVVVVGAVNRTGAFEFVPGDRLSDLIALGQGLAPHFDPSHCQLFRYTADGTEKHSLDVDLPAVLRGESAADTELRSGDWLVVRLRPGVEPPSTIRIEGEVAYPGYYLVDKNSTTLRQAIQMAGGFTPDASLWEARVVRQPVRAEEVNDPETPEGEDEGTPTDPYLALIESIPVSERTDDQHQYYMMRSRERVGQMVVDFVDLFEHGDESQNIALMPGDFIVVPPIQRSVIVSGQAANPGAVVHQPGMAPWDYIQKAGGLGWRASSDIRVIKARTGEMKRIDDVSELEPGDRIWIKEKPIRDYWALFTDAMEVVGQVSTVVLLYATLTR